MKVETLSQLLEDIYATAAQPQRWEGTLQSIADTFRGVGSLIIYQQAGGRLGTICTPSLQAAQFNYEREEWWRHDIRFTRSEQLGYLVARDAIADRHIATAEEIDSLPYYRNFLGRHGLKWFGGVSISPDPGVPAALSILRAIDEAPFSDEELQQLTLVGRHVENALRLGIRLIDADRGQRSFADILGRLGIGVLLLDDAGCVTFRNERTEALIGGNLAVVDGCLTSPIASVRDRLAAVVAQIGSRSPGWADATVKPTLIPLEEDGVTIALYVLPVASGDAGQASAILAEATTIVLIVRLGLDSDLDPSVLRDLFGFTLGEARLAALVGAGLSPLQASERLGIAEATARTVLRRVFEKAKVSRQSELTALLSRIAFRN